MWCESELTNSDFKIDFPIVSVMLQLPVSLDPIDYVSMGFVVKGSLPNDAHTINQKKSNLNLTHF